jgi:hypothetical protein
LRPEETDCVECRDYEQVPGIHGHEVHENGNPFVSEQERRLSLARQNPAEDASVRVHGFSHPV